MFYSIKQVFKEQIKYRDLILRMASFELKGLYQTHFLGTFWQFLNPAIQIAIYWFVFGIGFRGGTGVDGVPFFLWLIIGLIPWFFISPSIVQGSNSVHQQISLVSKMDFPVSVLPTIRIASQSFQFFIMMAFMLVIVLIYGVSPSVYMIQIIYYVICLYAFLFALTLLLSTLSTLVRDIQALLQSLMRMLFYLSPILWSTDLIVEKFDKWGALIENILQLNPIFYIVQGFRQSILDKTWFFENLLYTGYFWTFVFVLLYFGAKLHLKFRKNFMDYM